MAKKNKTRVKEDAVALDVLLEMGENVAVNVPPGHLIASRDGEVRATTASYGWRGRYWSAGETTMVVKGELMPHHFEYISESRMR